MWALAWHVCRKLVVCDPASFTSYICQRSMALANQEWHANIGTHTRGGMGLDVNVPRHLQSTLLAIFGWDPGEVQRGPGEIANPITCPPTYRLFVFFQSRFLHILSWCSNFAQQSRPQTPTRSELQYITTACLTVQGNSYNATICMVPMKNSP